MNLDPGRLPRSLALLGLCLAGLAAVGCSAPATAGSQEPPPSPPAPPTAELPEMPEQSAPTAQHRWLEQLVGDWRATSAPFVGPDGESTSWESRERVRSLGGLWVVAEGSAAMDGERFSSILTLGYDPAREVFVGTWIDTLQTRMWVYEGRLDESGQVLTLETDGPGFDDPERIDRYRDQIVLLAPDHRQLVSSVLGPDGSWTTYMTMDSRRVD